MNLDYWIQKYKKDYTEIKKPGINIMYNVVFYLEMIENGFENHADWIAQEENDR